MSIEWGYSSYLYAMLRARSSTMGSWETMMIDSGNNPAHIGTPSQLNIAAAELGYNADSYALLRMRSTQAGPWEGFYFVAA
ncbi:MAG TPA: hypothetical protein VGP31_10560 [Planosporangium sp.]|nr:hypothetical protein [Planosporangium sp.]